jgi:uncharacterized protein (TIGR03067 family)
MSRTPLLSLVLVLLAGVDAPAQQPAPAGARESLQGSWTLSSFVVNGDPALPDHAKGGQLVVSGDTYTPRFGTDAVPMRFTLGPDRAIDFTSVEGPHAGKTLKGIYALAGDTLTVCRALSEADPRPTRFEAAADSGHLLVVWRRSHAGAAERSRELARLQGTWVLASGTIDGHPVAPARARRTRLSILGTTFAMRIDGHMVAHESGFEIDTSTTPWSVDDTVLDGDEKGTVVPGIFKLDGDTLTSCMAAPGHERPTTFDAGPGTGRALRVFQRVADTTDRSAADGREHLRLEGSWQFASLTRGGRPEPAVSYREARLDLRGSRFVATGPLGSFHGSFTLDTDARLKTVDATFTDGPDAGHTLFGVYSLDGDTARLAFAPPGQPRPRGSDDSASLHSFVVLRRVGRQTHPASLWAGPGTRLP